jgi:hypothetical protein
MTKKSRGGSGGSDGGAGPMQGSGGGGGGESAPKNPNKRKKGWAKGELPQAAPASEVVPVNPKALNP